MFSLHGIGVSAGIVVARARLIESGHQVDVPHYHIKAAETEAEVARLQAAMREVQHELQSVGSQLPDDAPPEAKALLEVHAMLLDDPAFTGEAAQAIRQSRWCAEWALSAQAAELSAQFEAIEDEYLRERGRDVQQVADRVLRRLAGSPSAHAMADEPAVIVAADIAPADMLQLRHALGFVIDQGGVTSHTAILARGMNVPALVGAGRASELIRDDDLVILDGHRGVVVVAPDEAMLSEYRNLQAQEVLDRQRLLRLVHVPCVSLDGQAIELQANIETPTEASDAIAAGAQGIGLFRSEFLFLNRSRLPDEEEQYRAYRAAIEAMSPRPVTIRTLDVGADKALGVSGEDVHQAPNPALGLRAIRFCLAEPSLFLTQLRAILRASAHGKARILIPMLAHAHEVEQSLMRIEQAKQQLRKQGLQFDEAIAIGGMVEVPAAAICAVSFAKRLDFLSIGTNDLIQYTLAIDRADHHVASLYDPFHPAVLRLIQQTIRAAQRAAKPVAVCGEMAGEPRAALLLAAMGLRQFSMHPAHLLPVKQALLRADLASLSVRLQRVLASEDFERLPQFLARLTPA
jgi:phosphotransferase system enzyme I (PtsI)